MVHFRQRHGRLGKKDPWLVCVMVSSYLVFRVFRPLNSRDVKLAVKTTVDNFFDKRAAAHVVDVILCVPLGMPFSVLKYFFVGEVGPLAHNVLF